MTTDKSNIKIRQATIKDGSIIGKFYFETFAESTSLKYPSRWNWLYIENPFCKTTHELPLWIALDKDRVVGMAGSMQCRFQINQSTIKAAWGCDFRVSRDFRGKGLGKALEKARLSSLNFFSLDMSKVSRLVKTKLGALTGKAALNFLCVKRFEPSLLFKDFLRYLGIKSAETSLIYQIGLKLGAHKLFSTIVVLLFNFRSKKRSAESIKSNLSNLEYKNVDHFDEAVTQLWEKISKGYSLAVCRDSAYLNWKFVQQPHINYQRYIVLNNGELCGVLIFRLGEEPEIPIGTIVEAYTDKGTATLKEMLAFALKSLNEQGALIIRCVSTSAILSEILVNLGFRPFEYYVPVFLLNEKNCSMQQRAIDGEWFLSLGDQDLDEYPRVRQPSLKQIIQVILGKIIGQENLPNEDNSV
jgi:hypothetical protein